MNNIKIVNDEFRKKQIKILFLIMMEKRFFMKDLNIKIILKFIMKTKLFLVILSKNTIGKK